MLLGEDGSGQFLQAELEGHHAMQDSSPPELGLQVRGSSNVRMVGGSASAP